MKQIRKLLALLLSVIASALSVNVLISTENWRPVQTAMA